MQFNRAWLPLNGLRAFEATARRLSFTKAAEDLFVTQSAVSRQVQRLEELLGVKLVERRARDLVLTPEGQRLYAACVDSFDALSRSLREIVEKDSREKLRLFMSISFAEAFAPQIVGGFRARFPQIELEIDSDAAGLDFGAADYDLAILYARPEVTEHVMDLLFEEQLTPLVAPERAAATAGADAATFIDAHPLAHTKTEAGPYFAWEHWARRMGASAERTRRGLVFNTAALGVRWALEGGGAVATDPRLFRREIESGRLVQPFQERCPTGFGYYLVSRQDDLTTQPVRRFRGWVIDFFADETGAAG